MNFKKLLILLLLLPAVFCQQWITPLLRQVNHVRDDYDLPTVKYDYQLHNELIKIKNETWDGYFYEQMPAQCIKMPYSRCNPNRGYFLRPLGNYALFSDTILTPKKINLVMRQRIAQKKCMKIENCSKTEWTNFISCAKDPSVDFREPGPCIWFYHYFPKLLLKDLKSFACVILDYESGYSPIYQPYSFWCYSNANWFDRTSDYPF